MVFGKEVLLQTHGRDRSGRTLADVRLPDGTHINHTLVKVGWCWCIGDMRLGDTVFEGLEGEAREAKKGLWADPLWSGGTGGLLRVRLPEGSSSTRLLYFSAIRTGGKNATEILLA